MIFWELLCLQLIKLKGLIRFALPGPDQVDIWNQVHPYACWNDQIGTSKLLRPPLVRKGRRFFYGEMTMTNYTYDHGFKILLPQWESIQKESLSEKECSEKGIESKIGSIVSTPCTGTAGGNARAPREQAPRAPRTRWNGRCVLNTPFINTVATGQNINRLRIAAGFSVRDLQMIFGFATPQAIYKWIHGTALPTIDNLVILADVLDVTMDEIVVVNRTATRCG